MNENETDIQTRADGPPLEPMAFTLRQTAALLNVSYMTAFRLVQRGLLRSSSALRTKLISREEIQRFLRESMQVA